MYVAPGWLPEGHSQTIWPSLFAPRPTPVFRRERWSTPDGDFLLVDHLVTSATDTSAARPCLILFHGLEGSSASHYARTMMAAAEAHGWDGLVPHFRGCGGEDNLLPRAYHSGDSEEVDWIIRECRRRRAAAGRHGLLFVAGVSLGGNALLKWAGERGDEAQGLVSGVAAVSAPQDLALGADALARGFSRVYTKNFLKTLKVKSLAKLERFPGLYSREALLAARDFHDFDDLVTAPLHGFASCHDYWRRSSSRQFLGGVRVPTLVINALNDPFVPAQGLARPDEVSSVVTLDYPAAGGHVGFASGPFPGRLEWMPTRILDFFRHLTGPADRGTVQAADELGDPPNHGSSAHG